MQRPSFLLHIANKLRRTDPDTGWHTMLLLMLIYSLLVLAGIERGYPGQAGQAEFPYGVSRRIREGRMDPESRCNISV